MQNLDTKQVRIFNKDILNWIALLCGPLLFFFSCHSTSAQETSHQIMPLDTLCYTAIHFKNNKTNIDSLYKDNNIALKQITDVLQKKDSSENIRYRIKEIELRGAASPLGQSTYNKRLSQRRADSFEKYLHSLPGLDSLNVTKIAEGEDWHIFTRVIEENYWRFDRDDLLKILHSNSPTDIKKQKIIAMNGGRTWKFLVQNHMWPSRYVTTLVTADRIVLLPQLNLASQAKKLTEQLAYRQELKPQENEPYFALKTNLLFDAVTALNANIEIPLFDKYSISLTGLFPWWTAGPNGKKYALQIMEYGLEARNYFRSEKALDGWFVGIYASSAKYDLQWDKKICTQGEYWNAGLSMGYIMELSKRLRLEFSLSVGYLHSDYRKYQPSPDYEHLYRDPYRTGVFQFFGPTKACISLVLPIYL